MSDCIETGTRVELLPKKDGVYEFAQSGSQGVVADTRDEDGFSMVFIEWDKDHWRYTGEPDCWTFESHFAPVEDRIEIFDVMENPEEFLDKVYERALDSATDADLAESFVDRLSEALNGLAEGDGFLVISTRMEPDPDNPEQRLLIPYIYSAFLNEQAMALLEAQVIQLAAISHQEMYMTLLAKLQERRSEEEDDEGEQ